MEGRVYSSEQDAKLEQSHRTVRRRSIGLWRYSFGRTRRITCGSARCHGFVMRDH